MLPTMQHYATWAKITIRCIETIEAIGDAITPYIALCHKCATQGCEVRAIFV